MEPVSVTQGSSPVILAQPHSGTWLPDNVRAALNDEGLQLLDTDWRIPELYKWLVPEASIVRANFNRYAIDANRSPDGGNLYPGQNTTGLVPLTTFDAKPIWRVEPDEAEVARRLDALHRPYHLALREQIDRVRSAHGFAVLFDCHSIRSAIPYLFDGKLPDLNVGTNSGASCSPQLERAVAETCAASPEFTSVLNGRFRGGWTTRHYGEPGANVHAVQMEIAQSAYLESEAPPFALATRKADKLRALLACVFDAIDNSLGDLT